MKFKKINQFEIKGLKEVLKEAFPYLEDLTMGTSSNNLINLQNGFTENHPNSKFNHLGAFGLSEGLDIVLEYWDELGEESNYYWLTYRDACNFESGEPFNALLNKIA